MSDLVQVRAVIPRELKRRAFVVFAAREEKFSRWLREQLESWLQGVPELPESVRTLSDARLVGPETRG